MKNVLVGMMLASVFIVPAKAGGGSGSGSAPAASSSSTATGGAGGAGGSAAGGSATGGSATGGQSNGNTSTVSVSLTTDNSSGSGGGTSSGSTAGLATDPSTGAPANVQYSGSYTVKSAPAIVAPSLTSTFSDTCMGSSSFGLSFVGFGATGGTTMVDEACVRRLDSREFRAMGLNDVALALLCQSAANRTAVEATGRACPSAPAKSGDTASVASMITVSKATDRSTVAPVEKQIEKPVAPIAVTETPQFSQPINVANTEAKPMEVLSTEPVEIKPLPDALSEGK